MKTKAFFGKIIIAILIVSLSITSGSTVLATAEDPFVLRELSRYQLEEGLYFTGASIKHTSFDLIGDFVSDNIYKVYDKDKDITDTDRKMCTGLTLKNVSQNISVAVVVKGDVNGDGKILSSDYLTLKRVFSGIIKLEGAYRNAADINSDSKINSTDYLLLKSYFNGVDYFRKDIDVELTYVDFTKVKNVIFMIGDGMGPHHLDVARDVTGGNLKGKLYMDYIPNRGYEITDSLDGTTDSAAAATALSSGYKTHNGVVGRDGNGTNVQTLVELCMSRGMKTGVITSKVSTDATPASFTAHTSSRGNAEDIAYQQLMNMPEVLIGLNDDSYTAAMGRHDVKEKLNLYNIQRLYSTKEIMRANSDRIWGCISDGSLDLALLTEKSLNVLSRNNDNGFFIMIEGAKIDTYSHSNKARNMIKELIEFDLAVQVAMEYVSLHPDTLLIVTADHETGGLQYNPDSDPVYKYTTVNHTSTQPYVMALGYGAEYFNNVTVDNTDIPKFIAEQLGVYDFAS